MTSGSLPDCYVHGCQECSSDNMCGVCEDATALPRDGQCVCEKFFEKINAQGKCEPCFVAGCNECVVSQNMTCSKCLDDSATLDGNGKCRCPEGSHMNEDGHCNTCNVLGCKNCSATNSGICEECL